MRAEIDCSVQTVGITPAPQALKSGWSQVVRQQNRGTVSAPASPSKKQSNPSAGSRREAPTSRKFEIESRDLATASSKPREDRASGSVGAAKDSRNVHAGPPSHTSHPPEAGNAGTNADQVHSSKEKRLQAGREQETSTPSGQQGMVEVSWSQDCNLHVCSFTTNPVDVTDYFNLLLLVATNSVRQDAICWKIHQKADGHKWSRRSRHQEHYSDRMICSGRMACLALLARVVEF